MKQLDFNIQIFIVQYMEQQPSRKNVALPRLLFGSPIKRHPYL